MHINKTYGLLHIRFAAGGSIDWLNPVWLTLQLNYGCHTISGIRQDVPLAALLTIEHIYR